MTEAKNIANEIRGTEAAALLAGARSVRHFCSASDRLEELRLWTHDGETTPLGWEVRDLLCRECAKNCDPGAWQ